MQEKAFGRLGGHAMGSPWPLLRRLIELGVDRPRVVKSWTSIRQRTSMRGGDMDE